MNDFIEEGHGITDVSCNCGSRWLWYSDVNDWMLVVLAPNCTCGKPPKPFMLGVKKEGK